MKITVSQLRKIIKEEVQKTLNEDIKDDVMAQLDQEYGPQGYDVLGIVNTVFRELSPQQISGMSKEDLLAKCRELID